MELASAGQRRDDPHNQAWATWTPDRSRKENISENDVREAQALGMPVNPHILGQLSAEDLREPAPSPKGRHHNMVRG